MSKSTVCKEGDLVLLVSNTHNKGNHDENFSTITGIISYITDSSIGFECAIKHIIYKNGSTHLDMLHDFSVSREYSMITILKRSAFESEYLEDLKNETELNSLESQSYEG